MQVEVRVEAWAKEVASSQMVASYQEVLGSLVWTPCMH